MSLSLSKLPQTYILERERMLLDELRRGLAVVEWTELTIGNRLLVKVLRDALRWTVDGKPYRLGLTPYSSQQAADLLHGVLGTPKLSDVAARAALEAGGLVRPHPQKINDRTDGHIRHSLDIDKALPWGHCGIVRGWKAWLLSLDVWRKVGYATNYGWHVKRGRNVALRLIASATDPGLMVVQGPYEAHTTGTNTDTDPEAEIPGHGDYSQFESDIFLDACELDGKPALLSEILTGKHGADATALVSHEGPLPDSRLPGVPLPSRTVAAETVIEVAPAPEVAVSAAVWGSPLLRRGSRGAIVGELQARLGLAEPTDFFGPVTERMVRAFQASRGLGIDGVVGPKTWAALQAEPPIITVEPTPTTIPKGGLPPVSFRQARHYRRGRHGGRPTGITMHTAEIAEVSQAAESLQAACATWDRLASWHVAGDNDSLAGSVRAGDTAFAAGPGNDSDLHFELAGVARQSAADWNDPYSLDELGLARLQLEAWSREFDIPLRRITAEELLLDEIPRGVKDHVTWSAACVLARKRGLKIPRFWDARRKRWRNTNHGDCGPAFWDHAAPSLGVGGG